MIAPNESTRGSNGNGGTNGNGFVKRCIAFDRAQLTDLRELAWAANVSLDDVVREAVDRYRREPKTRTVP